MDKTKIDWCDSTWNPVTGCLHGCEYCYARGIAKRFSGHGEDWSDENIHILDKKIYGVEAERSEPYPYGFEPTFIDIGLMNISTRAAGISLYVLWLICSGNGCRIRGLKKYLRLVGGLHSTIICF